MSAGEKERLRQLICLITVGLVTLPKPTIRIGLTNGETK
jgi:hypothetical protein